MAPGGEPPGCAGLPLCFVEGWGRVGAGAWGPGPRPDGGIRVLLLGSSPLSAVVKTCESSGLIFLRPSFRPGLARAFPLLSL